MNAGRLHVHELHACADPECLGKVHDLLALIWETSPDVSALDRAMFETAVIEIAANIVRHGSEEGSTFCNLILEVYPDRLDARFKDDGQIAHVDLDAAAMPDDFAESGRGLAMAKAAVDVLTYRRHNNDNYWTLSRTRTAT
ncbi:ATP-binding protein [Arthrobacter sp. ISL-65]|uniref:ATP-binding protein n=1 Tax=Arthrobacter sp. ISL-65 TaxID=2819112 RepID=UPI001BE68199|nr:ATP-binding protein [Arthrobacter sp. ISL-65]MBT2551331.1 ATP-binding protein [Arthrobacter sp. ISL-65]